MNYITPEEMERQLRSIADVKPFLEKGGWAYLRRIKKGFDREGNIELWSPDPWPAEVFIVSEVESPTYEDLDYAAYGANELPCLIAERERQGGKRIHMLPVGDINLPGVMGDYWFSDIDGVRWEGDGTLAVPGAQLDYAFLNRLFPMVEVQFRSGQTTMVEPDELYPPTNEGYNAAEEFAPCRWTKKYLRRL